MAAPAATGLTAEEIGSYLRETLGADAAVDVAVAYGQVTVDVVPDALQKAARLCKSDPKLAFDFYDFASGVDLGDRGFALVHHLYSVQLRHHVTLRIHVPGGRDEPVAPSLSGVYRGANWHEREAYDMFGIDFEGHPGVLPRILTVENFEGFPLRKDFLLTTREAKPWPGAKEPGERKPDEEPPARPSTADPGVSGEDKAAAAKAKAEAVKKAAAGARADKAARGDDGGDARTEVVMDQATYDRLIAEGKSERIARAKAKAVAMRAQKAGTAPATASTTASGGDTAGAAAAQVRSGQGDSAPSSPEGAAQVAEADEADPAISQDAAAGAVGADVAAGAPGDVAGADRAVPDADAEAEVGRGAAATASGTPGQEKEGVHGGAEAHDVTGEDAPTAPAPGSAEAPVASDDQPQPPDAPEASESDLVQEQEGAAGSDDEDPEGDAR